MVASSGWPEVDSCSSDTPRSEARGTAHRSRSAETETSFRGLLDECATVNTTDADDAAAGTSTTPRAIRSAGVTWLGRRSRPATSLVPGPGRTRRPHVAEI